MGKQVELEITDLAFDGKAVAHRDGKVVFLNSGLPGERVAAEIVRSKPRYDQAIVHQILTRSDQRIAARCEHYEYCGGCTWQDLKYEHQLEYKQKQVGDCLKHLGGLDDVLVEDMFAAPEKFFYRNKMEFSFHTSAEKDFTLGLHRRGAYDDVFDLTECHLESEVSNRIVNRVREFVREHDLPAYDIIGHTGYMRFLAIRETAFTDQVMVNVVTNYGSFPLKEQLIEALKAISDKITTIVHNQNGQKSNIAVGEIEEILYGPGYIEEKILGKSFRITANSFFQTNPVQAENLYRIAFDMISLSPTDKVLDLYCGTGPIGILIADRVAEVLGVELVADAVEMARLNADNNKVSNISFEGGNVIDLLKNFITENREFDIIMIDPPRSGLHPKALRRTMRLKPKQILYISCNPATFARDAKELVAGGYSLTSVKPVDMFPHTRHIEMVAVLNRR